MMMMMLFAKRMMMMMIAMMMIAMMMMGGQTIPTGDWGGATRISQVPTLHIMIII